MHSILPNDLHHHDLDTKTSHLAQYTQCNETSAYSVVFKTEGEITHCPTNVSSHKEFQFVLNNNFADQTYRQCRRS